MAKLLTDPKLRDNLKKGTAVAFVGAGFSMGAGLPGWSSLLGGVQQAHETVARSEDSEITSLFGPKSNQASTRGKVLDWTTWGHKSRKTDFREYTMSLFLPLAWGEVIESSRLAEKIVMFFANRKGI